MAPDASKSVSNKRPLLTQNKKPATKRGQSTREEKREETASGPHREASPPPGGPGLAPVFRGLRAHRTLKHALITAMTKGTL